MHFTSFAFMMLSSFISLAFLTLMERKMLGWFQIRLGPSKTSIGGMLQPFSDALKLFIKSKLMLRYTLGFIWVVSAPLSMPILLSNISIIPYNEGPMNYAYSMLILMINLSLSIYFVIGSFYSGSKYSVLGMWRSLVLMMSYEIVLIYTLIALYSHKGSFMLVDLMDCNMDLLFFLFIPLWMLMMIMEAGRMPFDLVEGESELVSGFNTEYSSGSFAFIFIYEYGMIIFISMITSILFFNSVFSLSYFIFMMGFFIFIRGFSPRIRYDRLLLLSWKLVLPLAMLSSSILFI